MGYFEDIRNNLAGEGCEISQEDLASESVLIGYSSNLKAATKLHTFVAVAQRDQVNEIDVREFTALVMSLANERKGLFRGAQTGILALPVLIAQQASPGVAPLMTKPFRLNMGGFAAMAQPVVVDLGRREVHTFRGTRWWGFAYNSLIRKKLAAYLPDPR